MRTRHRKSLVVSLFRLPQIQPQQVTNNTTRYKKATYEHYIISALQNALPRLVRTRARMQNGLKTRSSRRLCMSRMLRAQRLLSHA
jgi:hypothetical protein